MAGARPAGRRLPAGAQGRARTGARRSASSRTTTCSGTACAHTRACRCTSARTRSSAQPAFSHPEFDMESRIVQADARQPGARLRVRAQRRQGLRGEARVHDAARRVGERGCTPKAASWSCAATSTSRAPRWTCIRASASPASSASARRSATLFEALLGEHLVDVGRALDPGQRRPFHLVGALAQHARPEHRLAPRLRARLAIHRRARAELPRARRRRHERPRAGGDDNRPRRAPARPRAQRPGPAPCGAGGRRPWAGARDPRRRFPAIARV